MPVIINSSFDSNPCGTKAGTSITSAYNSFDTSERLNRLELSKEMEKARNMKKKALGFESFLRVGEMRKMEKEVMSGDISYSKMIELINQRGHEFYDQKLKELEYKLIQAEHINGRYKQFIETEKLDDDFEEYLELFNNI